MSETIPESHRPSAPITEDQILRIDAALTKTMGHRAHAAEILGIEPKRLNNVIGSNEGLRAKWGKHVVEVPTSTDVSEMHRPAPVTPPDPDAALVEAHAKESAVWAKGMEKLGFTEEKRDFLQAVQSHHGNHWKQMSQMFQGGVSYTATELLFQFNKINATIQETYDHPEKFNRTMENQWGSYFTKTAHEVRMELTDRALAIAEMFRKLNSDSERATLIAAQVEQLKVEQAQDVKKRKKAKWAAKPVPVKESDGS